MEQGAWGREERAKNREQREKGKGVVYAIIMLSLKTFYRPIFVLNIWIAIARSNIPKTFLNASVTDLGNFFSRNGVLLRTMKMTSRLMAMPTMISAVSNEERSDNIVVSVPAPASNGNAIGTILPEVLPSLLSPLKKLIPSTISSPIKKIIKEPASANELTSTPKILRIVTPKNKKASIRIPAVRVAVEA